MILLGSGTPTTGRSAATQWLRVHGVPHRSLGRIANFQNRLYIARVEAEIEASK